MVEPYTAIMVHSWINDHFNDLIILDYMSDMSSRTVMSIRLNKYTSYTLQEHTNYKHRHTDTHFVAHFFTFDAETLCPIGRAVSSHFFLTHPFIFLVSDTV